VPVRASSLIRERPYRAHQESSLALERHHKFRCGDGGGKLTVETGAAGNGNIRGAHDGAIKVVRVKRSGGVLPKCNLMCEFPGHPRGRFATVIRGDSAHDQMVVALIGEPDVIRN